MCMGLVQRLMGDLPLERDSGFSMAEDATFRARYQLSRSIVLQKWWREPAVRALLPNPESVQRVLVPAFIDGNHYVRQHLPLLA